MRLGGGSRAGDTTPLRLKLLLSPLRPRLVLLHHDAHDAGNQRQRLGLVERELNGSFPGGFVARYLRRQRRVVGGDGVQADVVLVPGKIHEVRAVLLETRDGVADGFFRFRRGVLYDFPDLLQAGLGFCGETGDVGVEGGGFGGCHDGGFLTRSSLRLGRCVYPIFN